MPSMEELRAEYTYDFGKYRGRTLRLVQTEDPEYAAWCILSGVRLQRQSWRDALLAADLWDTVSQKVEEVRMEQRGVK